MKKFALLFTAAIVFSGVSRAAEPVEIDVFVNGELKKMVTLLGANATVSFTAADHPATTLELRLIAPEPLIVEMKETSASGAFETVVGRAKMINPGSAFAVSESVGNAFHHPYVLVRKN